MPYLQVELSAKRKMPAAARLAGTTEAAFCWGLLELWEWCWESAEDVATADHLEGLFGIEGVKVGRALVSFGFAEDIEGGRYRIRGAERYLRITEARRRAGQARASKATRDARGLLATHPAHAGQPASTHPAHAGQPASTPPALTPNTEHRTPREEEKTAGAVAPRSPPRPRRGPEKPPDPRHAPLVKNLVEAFGCLVGASYGFTARDARDVSKLLTLGQPDDVERRWRLALAHQGFPAVRRLSELVEHWNHFAGAGPPGRAARGRASEADKDWSNYTPNAAAF